MVWDEPMVLVDGEEIHPNPDLIAIKDNMLWWIEIKEYKSPISITQINKLIKAIKKTNESRSLVFRRKDGKEKVDNVKIDKVLIISGKGGFSAPANAFGMDRKFELMEPEDLKINIVVVKRISNDDKLLSVEIRVVPINSQEVITVPLQIKTSFGIENTSL